MDNDNFWNDERVRQCYIELRNRFENPNDHEPFWGGISKEIEKWKASHSLPVVDWEVIEFRVKHFLNTNDVPFTRGRDGMYSTGLDGEIFDFPERWFIVNNATIKTVKRKSDGVVFSVGDKIDMDECGEKPIDAFLIGGKGKECGHSENDLWLSTNKKKGYGTLLQYAIKIQSTQRTSERPPLGLLPTKFWKVARLNEIENAIIRFVNARREIPPEWITERDELLAWVKSLDLKYTFPKL